jgi:purine-binding chemotaxis protein CheW
MMVVGVESERYALPLSIAREVMELGRPVKLPGAPRAVIGIVNWRGSFVAVFDLGALAGAAPAAQPTRAVVLVGHEPPYALAVDRVEAIATIDTAALQPADPLMPRAAAMFRGAAADALLVIDQAALMARLAGNPDAA